MMVNQLFFKHKYIVKSYLTVAPTDLTSLTESSNGDDGANIVGNLGGKTSTTNHGKIYKSPFNKSCCR